MRHTFILSVLLLLGVIGFASGCNSRGGGDLDYTNRDGDSLSPDQRHRSYTDPSTGSQYYDSRSYPR